ncbi:ead/Ea22-like family protein [Citrobacter koseri]|uniref:ead/Ea22-like family protein n=2 Tax=Citrobacter koseri TaxID=545 RepID=UPI000E176E28|nr:ead/Ea22-like family protein [Citrobacter koseri]SUX61255.1 Uncharacterised protein [Citrobacter koseri]
MSNIDKQALRQLATDAHELGIIKRYTKGIEANKRFAATATPLTVLALLDELESDKEQIKTLESRNRRLEGIIDAAEKRISEPSGQKRLIGWRASDYTDETSDPELAKNWAAAIGVLPIFEGDVNTKLSVAGIGEGE